MDPWSHQVSTRKQDQTDNACAFSSTSVSMWSKAFCLGSVSSASGFLYRNCETVISSSSTRFLALLLGPGPKTKRRKRKKETVLSDQFLRIRAGCSVLMRCMLTSHSFTSHPSCLRVAGSLSTQPQPAFVAGIRLLIGALTCGLVKGSEVSPFLFARV